MAQLKRAKTGVAVYLESLQRHSTWIEDSIDGATLAQVRLRLDDVTNNFSLYEKNQLVIENEDDKDAAVNRANVEKLYFLVRPRLEEKVEELSRNRIPNFDRNISSKLSAKLPEIALTTFSGDIMKWCEFSECFDSLVHSNTALSVIAKFQYLKHALKDAAAQSIESLDFSAENYEVARAILKDRFNKPSRICEHHIKWLFTVKPLEKPCTRRLMEILDGFNSHLRSLRTLHRPTEQWDDLIVYLLSTKFDAETKEKWCEAAPVDKIATFNDISKFIKDRCAKLELLPAMRSPLTGYMKATPTSSPTTAQPRLRRIHNTSFSYHTASNGYYCVLCNKPSHSILRCYTFLKLTGIDRCEQVKKHDLCFNCLKPGHMVNKCPVQDLCKVCHQRHHTLLHLSTSTSNSPGTSANAESGSTSNHTITSSSKSTTLTSIGRRHGPSHVFLATALVKVFDRFNQPVVGRALLDSGSQLSFMSQSFASKLRIPLTKVSAEIGGIGSSSVQSSSSGWIKLQSMVAKFSADLEVLILPSITNIIPPISINTASWSIPANLQLADPAFAKAQTIDLLIGAELYFDLLKVGQVKLGEHLPCLQNTLLGWIVSGRLSNTAPTSTRQVSLLASLNSTINDDIERFWKLDTIPEGSKMLTTKDHPCDQHFVEHYTRDETGRFTVRLPFICQPAVLGESSTMAMRRFYNLEKRLSLNDSLHAAYKSFINEYLELGHMEQVRDDEIPASKFYLPHHCVIKPDSSTTKLRVVFDGSAKTSSGYSLNDVLMVGPVVQNDLASVLCRFRSHKYAFSTDVSKMYRQILIHQDDSNYQLIYWRNNQNEPLRSYRLKTVTYGTSSAPYLATRCLVQCALDNSMENAAASDAIKYDMYVDDMLTGANSINEVIQLKTSITQVLSTCGMELRKWCANSENIIADIPPEHREQLMPINNDDYIKTLGIFWQPQKDVFQFHVPQNAEHSKLTKRMVISEIARLFDPLGLVSPVVVLGKLFMQKLWQLKLDWDESLPMKYYTDWQNYRSKLCELNQLSIPRFLFEHMVPNDIIELHGFADASESAYGAALYTRCVLPNGKFNVQLLCAKSRIAPLQKTTLPRLELCAALLLAQLVSQVRAILNFPVHDVIYWTDSTIVLHWLNSSPSNLKTFVANRVANIQELTNPQHWYHIESKQNPADVVSRGMMPSALMKCELWFHGPQMLQSSKSPWLTATMPLEVEPKYCEYKKATTLMALVPSEDSILSRMKYINNYRKLTRVMAYAGRFIYNSRKKEDERISGPLTNQDFETGLIRIIQLVQAAYFADVTEGLRGKDFIVRSNHLKSLSLFLDSNGLIRVGGRLQFSSLPYSTKHPILLPASHPFTKTLFVYFHRKYLHIGPQALLATVREQFWPINGRKLAAQVFRDCVRCRRIRPTPIMQKMGSLPKERVEPAPPFHCVGIDFCGPFYITQRIRGRAPIKTYLCIFVCFGTKAVHLELASDLSSAAFLGAFRRFCATRGLCKKVVSDNGTNFVGANSELHQLYRLLQDSNLRHDIKLMCQDDNIEWTFAPPRSPHFGGLYEAAVKSAKFHLRRVMGNESFTYEEFNTLCKQVEAILNSRPITPLTATPDGTAILTPGHFLIGRPLTAIPEPNITGENIGYNKRWRLIQQLIQHFWTRWSKDYLQELQHRRKWTIQQPNIAIGQIVLVKDDNLPPMKWQMGRIVSTHPGADGLVRVVSVKTETGIYQRAITKICSLPLDVELDESSRRGE